MLNKVRGNMLSFCEKVGHIRENQICKQEPNGIYWNRNRDTISDIKQSMCLMLEKMSKESIIELKKIVEIIRLEEVQEKKKIHKLIMLQESVGQYKRV